MKNLLEYLINNHIKNNKYEIGKRLVIDNIPCTVIGSIDDSTYVLSDYRVLYTTNGNYRYVNLDDVKTNEQFNNILSCYDDGLFRSSDILNALDEESEMNGWAIPSINILKQLDINKIFKTKQRYEDESNGFALGKYRLINSIWCFDKGDFKLFKISHNDMVKDNNINKTAFGSLRFIKILHND